ncbi:MAG: para-nitrobenzyl esterase, partial [Chitinophagales bacterium]
MKQIFTLFLSFFLISTYAQTCAGRYQTEIYNQVDVSTVDYGSAVNVFGNTQTLQMDIYQAVGDTATDRPVVIFCFGGSFTAGSRTSGELVDFATDLAKRGFVCASIDYRLAGSPLELVIEENIIKVVFSAVQDGKAAIRYFRKDFDEGNSLGISPDNIFIGGTSAGGILAANLAYVDDV